MTAPSKVLHVRSLPSDCTEQELINIACPFGRVSGVLMLKGKGQAFVQMENEVCSTALVQYYNNVQANIRGRAIFFQYSSRDEISTPAHSNTQSAPSAGVGGGGVGVGNNPEAPNTILLVSVLNMVFPVGMDVLNRIFSKYGQILKIVIFQKSAGFQSLIQFSDLNSAIVAKQELDGQNIYAGCCTLRIQFSRLPNLTVKFNNENSRDFTNPHLPTTSPPASAAGGGPTAAMGMGDPSFGMYPFNSMGTNPYSPYPPAVPPPASAPYGATPPMASGGGGQTVLIVSGLVPEKVMPQHLFNLFGVYGDVNRVKVLFNKKDTALVQFCTPQQAETALMNLNGVPLLGNTLRVNVSKHTNIQMPRVPLDQGGDLTQDFTGSPLHRFKQAGSKNFNHIFPPSAVLHLSNLAQDLTEDAVKEEFAKFGQVTGFKFFLKDKRMALIQFSTVGEAVDALVHMHNAPIGTNNIRVSFSKSTL
eukprot:CAMPEP_0177684718 /NCGR_PEP_ID=MMETSP0447-20121125/32584_1 /TAXON_ID=0 /ORGANISM="Stygamoeba regulata, Strain BSH-02190019" /LENGTH=473 /DNA_ID=CAMNT_0019194591 /DNA_START=522 /DNA_END=1943 /DNA_ORIENTATION=-